MDNYITGAAIKQLREKRGMTQAELADQIGVSGKAVSKWETGRGLPDISLVHLLHNEKQCHDFRDGSRRERQIRVFRIENGTGFRFHQHSRIRVYVKRHLIRHPGRYGKCDKEDARQ